MRIFDPHIHCIARVTDDYERMALAHVAAVLEPSFWLGAPRTSAGTFEDYFNLMLEWETDRAWNHGIRHFTLISLNPREANDRALARDVLAILPRWLDHPNCVGIGEIGFDDITPAEEEAFRAQLDLARRKDLPAMIHTPHRRKREGTERTLAILREVGADPDKVLIDHNTEETIAMVRDAGFWAGHTVYPVTKLSPERAATIFETHGVERMLVNSSADWGPSDPLSVPKTVLELRKRGMAEGEVESLVWNNPIAFFGQSGRLDLPGGV